MERTLDQHEELIRNQALSVCRVAKRLNVSERTARRLIEVGDLKAYRIGRQWRVFEPDLQEYLASQANGHLCRHYSAGHNGGGAAAGLAVEAATGKQRHSSTSNRTSRPPEL